MKKSLAILLLLAVQINAYPYENPIVADRPGYTSTTHTVRPGKYVVEPGCEYAFNNDRVKQVTYREKNIILYGAYQYLLTEKVQPDINASATEQRLYQLCRFRTGIPFLICQ